MLKLGWLSPEGKFIELENKSCFKKAKEILNSLDISYRGQEPDELLIEQGWCSVDVGKYWKKDYQIWWNKNLTSKQKEFLIPYFNDETKASYVSRKKWEKENNFYEI